MALIERDAAIEALPVMSELRPIFLEAWEEWRGLPPSFASKMSPGARAFAVHDLIVDAASRRLGNVARMFDKAGLKLFVFDEGICLRFKKHDEEMASRGQPTQQIKDFLGQEILSGIPAAHNLEAGYVLDPSETSITATNLICPNGYKNRPYWYIELKDEGYQCGISGLFDRGPTPDAPDSTPARSMWKSRESGVVIPFKRSVKTDDQS